LKRKIVVGFLTVLLMLPMSTYILPVSAQSEDPTWQMYRPKLDPYDTYHINETISNADTNDEASVGIGVNIMDYVEDWQWDPYLGRDGVALRVALTANTRKGITYYHLGPSLYVADEWIEAVDPVPIIGDNNGTWLDITLDDGARFFGGPGYECQSAEYNKVWVCDNGFLSFDSEITDPPPPATTIPDPAEPNSLLAVHWADLLVDDQAEITYYGNLDVFCVLWKNVINKNNGQRQTFEVIIERNRLFERGQNAIKFLYQDVTWADSGALVGIEDQEGYKGTLGSQPLNGEKLEFLPHKKSAEIRKLKIKIEKQGSDPNALIDIDAGEDYERLKGINVMVANDNPDTEYWYSDALNDGLALLMSSFVIPILLKSNTAGLIFEISLITLDAAAAYAREFSPFKKEEADVVDAGINDPEAHVYAKAEGAYGWPVDAAIGAQVHWVFTDDTTEDHSVKITAELEYTYYNTYGVSYDDTISTSVILNMEIGHALTLSANSGGTTDPLPGDYTYHKGTPVEVTALPNDGYDFDYWLLDGSPDDNNPATVTMNTDHTLEAYFKKTYTLTIQTTTGGTTNPSPGPYVHDEGTPVTVWAINYTNYEFNYWKLDGQPKYDNPYTVTMNSDHTLTAYFSYVGGGGGGTCPILYVYDGENYIDEGALNIHNPEGFDVVHRRILTTDPEPVNNKVLLRLVEHPLTHSHLDEVDLYVIDENDYLTELPLIKAVHSEYGNVLPELMFSDDERTDADGNESIDLEFQLNPNITAKAFIFVIEGYNPEFK